MPKTPSRYYTEHRDELCAKMRERSAKRREAQRMFLRDHPEAIPEQRAQWRDKYYRCVASRAKRLMEAWLSDPTTPAPTKDLLRHLLSSDTTPLSHWTPKRLALLADLLSGQKHDSPVDESSDDHSSECVSECVSECNSADKPRTSIPRDTFHAFPAEDDHDDTDLWRSLQASA